MSKYLKGTVPPELLHSMETVLQTYHHRLSSWNDDLTERIKALDGQVAQLDGLGQTWKSTLQSPELPKIAPELPRRVQDLTDSVHDTRDRAASLREKALALQGHVLETAALLQGFAPVFERAQGNLVRHLLIQDSPPFWNVRAERWQDELRASLIPPASAGLLRAYVAHEPVILSLHVALIGLFFLSVRWLRRGLHRWTEEEPELRRAAPAFDLPLPTAVTLSFLVTGPIYTTAPFLLRAILWGVFLFSIVFILRRLIERALFPVLSALLVWYFVDQLRLLTAVLPLLGRSVFGAEALGGTLFCLWWVRRNRPPRVGVVRRQPLAGAMGVIAYGGLAVFSVTFLATLFGYINFANLLAGGALRSAYVGAALYAALRIVEGLVIISLGTRPLSLTRAVRLNRPLLQRRLVRFARFLALAYWASLTLNFLGLWRPFVTGTEGVLRATLTAGSLSISIQQVLAFPATVWAAFAISRFLRFLLDEDIYRHWRFALGVPQAISTLIHYAILLIGFFLGLAALGVDLTKVTILAGAFTVGVGFGLQTVINNFVCGLLLLFERPIKIGDVIQVDADVGEVRRIGVRACVIRTADGSEIIVPNGTIISNKVTNWTLSDRYRAVELSVTVARGTAPQRVVEVLKRVAADQPGLAKEPAPQAHVVKFAPDAVSFNLRAWTERFEDWVQVRSDLSVAVDEALTREKITVA